MQNKRAKPEVVAQDLLQPKPSVPL